MTIVRRLIEAGEVRALTDFGGWSPDGRIPSPTDGYAAAGTFVNESSAMQVIDVYACVSLIADSLAMLPIDQFRKADGFRAPVRLSPLISQPDPEIERGDWITRAVTSFLLRGNTYAPITERDSLGFAVSAVVVHPDDIRPVRNRETGRKEFKTRAGQVLPARDVIHIPWVQVPGRLDGLSPIECARRGLGLSIATENFGMKWFDEGAVPSSVIENDAGQTDEQAKRVLARWMVAQRGRRKPAVMSGGWKWRQVSVNPNDSQFLETRKLNTSAIARLFRVAPHLIGDVEKSTSWGAGIENQGIGFVVYTLGNPISRLEAAFNRQLPKPQYTKINVGALLRGNTKDRYLGYAIARQWGWLSVNDIRALEDLPPVEGGDVYLQPMNMIDAGEALKALLADNNQPPGGPVDG